MTPGWLLHDDTVSALLAGTPAGVRLHVLKLEHPQLGISALTQARLLDRLNWLEAIQTARLRALLDEFFRWVEVLPWDGAAARQLPRYQHSARTHGSQLSQHDLMLAAQAQAHALPLVSPNPGFDVLPDLRRESWANG